MKKLASLLGLLGLCTILLGQGTCRNLFISEYIEGTGFNKAIEIYNPTHQIIDLEKNKLRLYKNMNGGAFIDTIWLKGFIFPGDVYVIADTGAAAQINSAADSISSTINHSGDDSYILYSGLDDTLDVFGQAGSFPVGVAWAVTGGTSQNSTLIRQPYVTSGSSDWAQVSTEWDVRTVDFLDSLGTHSDTVTSIPDSITCLPIFELGAFTLGWREDLGNVTRSIWASVPAADTASFSIREVLSSVRMHATYQDDWFFQDSAFTMLPGDSTRDLTFVLVDDTLQEGSETIQSGLEEPKGCLLAVGEFLISLNVQDSLAACSYLMFSEYLEGSANNKAYEIYNPLPYPVDLSEYQVETYANGGTTPAYLLGMRGTLQPFETYVVANPSANASILAAADTTHTTTFFNGNDRLRLTHLPSGHLADVIGDVPSNFNIQLQNGTQLFNRTIVRQDNVYHGHGEWVGRGWSEFDVFPIDFSDSLGTHYNSFCFTPPLLRWTIDTFSDFEGNDTFSVSVQLSYNPSDTVEAGFSFDASVSTATDGADMEFASLNTSIVFAPGDTLFKSFAFRYIDDAASEGNEYGRIRMTLNRGTAVLGVDSILVAEIRDNDVFVPSGYSFRTDSTTVDEAAGTIGISVVVDSTGSDTVRLGIYRDAASVADTVLDFSIALDTLTFLPFDTTSKDFSLSINDDLLIEPDEDLLLILDPLGSGATIGNAQHLVRITNNDYPSPSTCAELIFTEYIEGTGDNRALEIYNNDDSLLDLSQYTIYRYDDAANFPSDTLQLSGNMLPGAILVIADLSTSLDPKIAAQVDIDDDITSFDGDDVLTINKGGAVVDQIGRLGWYAGQPYELPDGGTTRNHTLIRRADIVNSTPGWIFGAYTWMSFPNNTLDSLGTHYDTVLCGEQPVQLGFNEEDTSVTEGDAPLVIDLHGWNVNLASTIFYCEVDAASTADSGTDFSIDLSADTMLPGFVNFTSSFSFTVNDDASVEGTEEAVLKLRSITNSGIFMDTILRINIIDNDLPRVYMVDASRTENENAGTIVLNVGLDFPDANPTSVDVEVQGGSATGGSDYTYTTTTVTFPGGSGANQTAIVSIIDDADFEGDENVTFVLRNPTNSAQLGDSLTELTIVDNDQPAAGFCFELLFSEYMEGSSNEKALEIYNPTDSAIVLDGSYEIWRYSNGSTTASDLQLTGTINAGSAFVIANTNSSDSVLARADLTTAFLNHNGNDAFQLVKDSVAIDQIGEVGVDPGSNGWTIPGGFSTRDNTLRRRDDVYEGTTSWDSTQWDGFAQDVFDGLGTHTSLNCTSDSGGSVGIADIESLVGLQLYPNPAEDVVYINSPLELDGWKLLDVQGRVLKQQELDGQLRIEIPLEGLADGIYLVRYKRDGKWGQERLIKR